MAPKIEFRRSYIYDHNLKPLRSKDYVFPSDKILNTQIKKLEKLWAKDGSKILIEIAKVLKLRWTQKNTTCYVTAGVYAFSDPLTISYNKNTNSMLDELTHEMIHRLWSEEKNWKTLTPNWQALQRKYKGISMTTRSHFPLLAVHKHILLKFYGKKRLEAEINSMIHSDYIKAWDIVNKDGYENIIKQLTKGR